MLRPLIALCLFALAFDFAHAQTSTSPSFDCSKAGAPDERAICASPQLSSLDLLLNDGYHRMVEKLGRTVANKVHGPFMTRRHGCRQVQACILATGEAELPILAIADSSFRWPVEFSITPTPYDELKKQLKIGDCTLSTISQLGPRLCNPDASGNCPDNLPFDQSGNSISADNQISGVSYDRIPALEKSRLGDRVLICLKSIPTDCPTGDDRGYDWNWRNLRTLGKWDLPDSQHMCGGA